MKKASDWMQIVGLLAMMVMAKTGKNCMENWVTKPQVATNPDANANVLSKPASR